LKPQNHDWWFFSPQSFVAIDILPHGAILTGRHFRNHVIVPLTQQEAQQRGDVAQRKAQ
jgi:hypothetical protein